jgi:hypothetical protein
MKRLWLNRGYLLVRTSGELSRDRKATINAEELIRKSSNNSSRY